MVYLKQYFMKESYTALDSSKEKIGESFLDTLESVMSEKGSPEKRVVKIYTQRKGTYMSASSTYVPCFCVRISIILLVFWIAFSFWHH